VLLIFKKYNNEIIMDNIIEPNNSFDFSKLSLAHPVGIQGGAYFTKLLYNNKPLYIQTTKSLTRQGFVKSGKKYYCDLMFDNNSETLINWFENLEETCQKLIFDKSEAWFQNSLDRNDVESAFNSVIRIYKSGKYYLVRTNIKIASNNNEPAVKIYNENELPLTIDDVKENTNIISILEIQGIKFTSRNFQIDIELRQSMVLDNEPLFDNCLIKTYTSNKTLILDHEKKESNSLVKNKEEPLENISITETNNSDENDTIDRNIGLGLDLELDLGKETNLETNDLQEDAAEIENEIGLDNEDDSYQHVGNDEVITLDVQELEDKTELKELDWNLPLENDLEVSENVPIKLKKPNEVYYELYKEAREKAKIAKKSAIIAYLEAKNIRQTYMIDNLDESESDIDAEIDEVSESELEGL
jgi:hypothetical protein